MPLKIYINSAYLFYLAAALIGASENLPAQLKLLHDMLETYDKKSKPVWDHRRPINVTFSMDLYQILEVVGTCILLVPSMISSQTLLAFEPLEPDLMRLT
ncbi:unnamed protein product [Gongylonema pulchrum]|uniref:Neur_chan_LBD domain-containing protein n=1 Tax=Gongylonema pulchrum TaxID=637853 RepID=A0A183ET95_9BILA|nr:unnamed protein product [Gongylonema pulchrum]